MDTTTAADATTPGGTAAPSPSPAKAAPEPALDAVSLNALRGPAVRRLLALRAQRQLTRAHVRTTAQCLAVSDRTVWRWLADTTAEPATAEHPGARRADRFKITPEIRVLLAYWHGNASAVHRELLARAITGRPESGRPDPVASAITIPETARPDTAADETAPQPTAGQSSGPVIPGGAPSSAVPVLGEVPSLSTFLRAVRRDLTAGERAGYRKGPQAARALDVFGKRPRMWRNHVWEGDHVQAPLQVLADGKLVRPYVTWFIDCATKAITGLAITPGCPSRASILVALRSAVLRTGPYGPIGGRPETVRIDRGKDFLSRTVTAAFVAFDTTVDDLPAYSPHLKGSIENLNRNATRMLFAALPGYRPKQPRRRPDRIPTAPALSFEDFTAEVLAWAHWWNTGHQPDGLHGRTPLQAWQADPTPLTDIPPDDLWSFTLEDDACTRHITSHGVRFKKRDYLADWMTGQAGREVRVRFMPHHTHEIEVCDPHGRRLGTAYLADQATPEQLGALRRARSRRAQRLRAEAKAAEQLRQERFAPATTVTAPQRLEAVTAAEASRELSRHHGGDLTALALPDLIPPAAPPDDWATSDALKARTRPAHAADRP